MPDKKMQNHDSKPELTWFHSIGKILSLLLIVMGCCGVIIGAWKWCHFIQLFKIAQVEIEGISIVTTETVRELSGINDLSTLFSVDLRSAQERLEQSPYIKAAIVSRRFPGTLVILIRERVPVCFLNQRDLFLVDQEGYLMPVPDTRLNGNLPLINGFQSDTVRHCAGSLIANPQLLELVHLIARTGEESPLLYNSISEVLRTEDGQCVIYSTRGGTPVFLGSGNIAEKFRILAHFQHLLRYRRDLSDYQYVDLRWNKQVIVKERRL